MRLKAARGEGFALMEVLVSLLLVGLAAAAWLQAQAAALRQTRLSTHQALAMMLADDMAERLRASPASAPALADAASFAAQAAPSVTSCQTGGCDAQAWARADASQWRALVREALPQGSAWLVLDESTRQARITLAWRDQAAADGDPASRSRSGCPPELALGAQEAVLCHTLVIAW